jgi:hypothetical protein
MKDVGPQNAVRQLVMGFRGTHLLYLMAELGIADLLTDGPLRSAELAARLGANPDALHRVLRALTQLGMLDQEPDGRFTLTPSGDTLRSDRPDSLRPVARFWGHEMLQRAWGNLRHTVLTGQTAFDHAFGMSAFAYLEANPGAAAVYHAGMSRTRAMSSPAVVAAYDFSSCNTIIDVGGGNGSLLAEILRAFPEPQGVICDSPNARAEADEMLAASGLTARARFEACDFFSAIPVGGDCYLLRQIIHDWDDTLAAAILKTCRQAISPNARLLLIEYLLPDAGDPGLEEIMVDVTMLARVGGRERTEAEYRELLDPAGFRLERVIPTATRHQILECIPV